MKKYFLPTILVFIVLAACQKVVDADKLLDTEPKVFITGYISPADTVFSVNVSRAFSSVGTPFSVWDTEANRDKFLIKNAQVSISDEQGNSTTLNYSEESQIYRSPATSLAILTDNQYFLSVIVDGQEFNASCRIPKKVASIEEEIIVREDEFDGKRANVDLRFQDLIGQRDYYAIGGIVSLTYQQEGYEPETYQYSLFFEDNYLLTDGLEDGGILSGRSSENLLNTSDFVEAELTLQVANMEEILFQNLRVNDTNPDVDDNPFVEYSIAPDNFEEDGAIGVFSGYQLTVKTFDISEIFR